MELALNIASIVLIAIFLIFHRKFQYNNSTVLLNRIDSDLNETCLIKILEILYDVKIGQYNKNEDAFYIQNKLGGYIQNKPDLDDKTLASIELSMSNQFKLDDIPLALKKVFPDVLIKLNSDGNSETN